MGAGKRVCGKIHTHINIYIHIHIDRGREIHVRSDSTIHYLSNNSNNTPNEQELFVRRGEKNPRYVYEEG